MKEILHKLKTFVLFMPFFGVTALAGNAADGSSTSRQAMAFFQKGNYKAAQPLLEKLVASSPSDGRALYYLALVCYKQNDMAKAQNHFQQIVSAFPNSAEAKYSVQYLKAIEGKSVFSEENAAPPKPTSLPVNSVSNDKAERDLAEAKTQAEAIIAESKRHAAEFDKQAAQMSDELKQVLVGKRFARPAYSQEQINAFTADLHQQSKFTLERGKKEAEDLLNRAQLRYEAQTRSH